LVIDKQSSERLSMLRFPLILGVIFIHVSGSVVTLKGSNLAGVEGYFLFALIQDFISNGLAKVAVPLFFFMSGFWFFLNFRLSLSSYKNKVKSRFYTLFIPFLFWNLFVMLFLFVAQIIPQTSIYFSGNKQSIITYSIFDFFNNLLGFTKFPIAYQFWFIRDLMVMVVLSPLLSLIFKSKYFATVFGILLTVLWLFKVWPVYIPSLAAFYFFYIGCYISRYEINVFSIDRFGKSLCSIYIFLLLTDIATKNFTYNTSIHNLGILFGIASALCVTKHIWHHNKVKQALLNLGSCSFFIFALHEPLVTILMKVIYKVSPDNFDSFIIFVYLLMPCLTVGVLLIFHKITLRIAPKSLSYVTGGR